MRLKTKTETVVGGVEAAVSPVAVTRGCYATALPRDEIVISFGKHLEVRLVTTPMDAKQLSQLGAAIEQSGAHGAMWRLTLERTQ
jgi:hypothetical protein